MQRWYITKIPQRHGLKQAQQRYSQYKHICIEFIYEIIQLRLLQTVWCWCAKLMRWCCLIVPVTGLSGELHLKQEARASFAAMSREHVTEEDIETFMHVQDIAMQVGKLVVGDWTLTNLCSLDFFRLTKTITLVSGIFMVLHHIGVMPLI